MAMSSAPEVAGGMVENIRADESPHVEYLRTALSEVRARTLRTVDGGEIDGRVVVDGLIHRVLSQMTRNRRNDQRDDIRDGLLAAMEGTANANALLEEFDSLDSVWTPPE